jgi:glycosyltransferase involved in cell wall biosynthesis
VDLYRPTCGDKMVAWPVGIDTDRWGDVSGHAKDTDVIIYDKIRWDRETVVPRVLERVTQHLDKLGRSYKVLRYGHHHHSEFASYLKRSKGMIFLCEHETQGLACQEALASNVPVLAWDEGVLIDPMATPFAPPGLVVSSVPYFDGRCGERFKMKDFEPTFESFWKGIAASSYRPRQFIVDTLSLPRSADAYLSLYGSLM